VAADIRRCPVKCRSRSTLRTRRPYLDYPIPSPLPGRKPVIHCLRSWAVCYLFSAFPRLRLGIFGRRCLHDAPKIVLESRNPIRAGHPLLPSHISIRVFTAAVILRHYRDGSHQSVPTPIHFHRRSDLPRIKYAASDLRRTDREKGVDRSLFKGQSVGAILHTSHFIMIAIQKTGSMRPYLAYTC
jgi:hypothetical protein